ncbi:hypothetical protein QJS66_18165 [Kocuria rhizophila]|nr:hypothetical protein QJS66_18165 [Kocuria rhizophila]
MVVMSTGSPFVSARCAQRGTTLDSAAPDPRLLFAVGMEPAPGPRKSPLLACSAIPWRCSHPRQAPAVHDERLDHYASPTPSCAASPGAYSCSSPATASSAWTPVRRGHPPAVRRHGRA